MKILLTLILFPLMLSAQTNDKKLNLFALGDSNGTYPHSWPKQLEQVLAANVVNISKSGRTIGFINNGDSSLNSLLVIHENIEKAATAIGDGSFDFVILVLGTNDAKAVFAERQKEVPVNLETLLRSIKECKYNAVRNAKIIIVSPIPYGTKAEATEKYKGGRARVEKMSRSFRKIARKHGCLFVNGFETIGADIETMTTDGIHLDDAGSKKLIKPIVDLLK